MKDSIAYLYKNNGDDLNFLKMKNLFIIFILVFTITNGMAQNDVIIRTYTPPSAKYGVIDTNGRVAVPFEYTQILPFHDGVACASKSVNNRFRETNDATDEKVVIELPAYQELWGLIDYNGNELTPFIYLHLQNSTADNRFIARNKEEKWGVINRNGETIIPFEYSQIWEHQGLFFCKHIKKAYLILDANGKVINPSGYEDISYDVWFNAYRVRKNGKEGIVNTDGQESVLCKFDKLGIRGWNEGLLCVMNNKKWGFIDSGFDLLIPYEYKDESFFVDGIANVETEDKQRMAIDKKGNILYRIPFGIQGNFGDKAYITREAYIKGDRSASFKAALVDNELNNITPYEYEKIYRLSGNAYLASHDGEIFGMINEKGKKLLPEKYEISKSLMTVGDSYIWLMQNGKYGLIDFTNKGKKVFDFEYDDVKYTHISKNDKWGAFDMQTGKITIPIKYDTIQSLWGRSFVVTANNKWGIVDMSDKIILPVEYDEIKDLKETGGAGWYMLRNGNKYGLINSLNNLIECKYDTIGFIPNLNMQNNFITAGLNESVEIFKASEQGFERITSVNAPFIPQSFVDDFIIVSNSGKVGVMDIQGKEIIPCKYSLIPSYSEGYFVVREAYKLPNDDEEILPIKLHKRY